MEGTVEAAEVTLVDLPPLWVELLEPVPVCEPVLEGELGALGAPVWPVPVLEVELTGVPAAVVPSAPVAVELEVLDGVEVELLVDDTGALGFVVGAPEVPSVVELGVEVTGVEVGSVGSVTLSGLPGP